MKGVGLKLSRNTGVVSPVSMLNMMKELSKNTGGVVYYCTDIMIAAQNRGVDHVLFIIPAKCESFQFVLADVVSLTCSTKGGFVNDGRTIPSDAERYCPKILIDSKRTWLKIKNLRRANIEFINSLKVNTNAREHPLLLESLKNNPRQNRVYWYTPDETSLDFGEELVF